MKNLKILYLSGNNFLKKMKNYRKVFISSLPSLKHLVTFFIFKLN